MLRHQRELHSGSSGSHTCVKCGVTYRRERNLTAHLTSCSGPKRKRKVSSINEEPEAKQKREEAEQIAFEIANVPEEMGEDYDGPLLGQSQVGSVNQDGGGQDDIEELSDVEVECALDELAVRFRYHPNKQQKYDLLLTLQGKKKNITKQLGKELKKKKGIKWFICTKVKMVKTSPDGQVESTPHFRSLTITTTNDSELQQEYDKAVEKIKTSFLEYQREGSGWQLEMVRIHLQSI